jgi:hypothetical protein
MWPTTLIINQLGTPQASPIDRRPVDRLAIASAATMPVTKSNNEVGSGTGVSDPAPDLSFASSACRSALVMAPSASTSAIDNSPASDKL